MFDDADPAAVAEGIKIAGYWNSGQDCTAASRVMAGPRIYDKLLDELVPAVESLQVGDPATSDDVEMGPVISKSQQERVFGFLERASGAKVLTGGGSNGDRGFFVQPTVITEVGQEDEIVQKEVFGPVVTVQRFADDDQALAWANDVPYGLSASVWTRDIGRALNAARKLQFGTVWINDHIPLVSEMPHGGYKQSGYGKDLSVYSLEDYTQIKHVMVEDRLMATDAAAAPLGVEGAPGEKGLKADALGFVSSVVIGVASTAPGYSLAASLGLVVAAVGLQSPAIMWVSFIPMLLVATAYYYLNRVDPDCGTTFSWATKAFGPWVGWLGGWGIIVAGRDRDGEPRGHRRPVHVPALRGRQLRGQQVLGDCCSA